MCKATHEHVWDEGRRSKLAKESSRNDGHIRFLNWQGFTRFVLSSPEKFEMSGARRRLRWVRKTSGSCFDAKRVESKLEINTTILRDEPGMSKEVKILNRKLCWHDGLGLSYETDQKHARNRSIQFDVFEDPHVQRRARMVCETKQMTLWRRESWESWA